MKYEALLKVKPVFLNLFHLWPYGESVMFDKYVLVWDFGFVILFWSYGLMYHVVPTLLAPPQCSNN